MLGEFLNHNVIGWAATRKIFLTRSRPYKKNDQVTIESKNGHLARRYGFYWRYDTADELTLLKQLIDAGVLFPAQEAELCERREQLNPAQIARRIHSIQGRLTGLACGKTLNLQAATQTTLPETDRGVRRRAS